MAVIFNLQQQYLARACNHSKVTGQNTQKSKKIDAEHRMAKNINNENFHKVTGVKNLAEFIHRGRKTHWGIILRSEHAHKVTYQNLHIILMERKGRKANLYAFLKR